MKVECAYCGAEFDKRKDQVEKTNRNFCCRSHAASFNNKAHPKRKPEHVCSDCGKPLPSKADRCSKCKVKFTHSEYSKRTLGSTLYGDEDTATPYRYSHVRRHAKKVLEFTGREKKCEKCGYDKHVEACHIKAIVDFDLDSLLSEVNSPDNLLYLCPNCHWEHDHGGVA